MTVTIAFINCVPKLSSRHRGIGPPTEQDAEEPERPARDSRLHARRPAVWPIWSWQDSPRQRGRRDATISKGSPAHTEGTCCRSARRTNSLRGRTSPLPPEDAFPGASFAHSRIQNEQMPPASAVWIQFPRDRRNANPQAATSCQHEQSAACSSYFRYSPKPGYIDPS